ncbi:MAG: lipid A export permease/ATP-binding protein MsbA [Porticoccaceae bacterium]|jgi:subfamily B ATP-binding cassette protein MsbA|nr:lipid A export permease/ATP-binding protein MsbA [Porticoccaceae bacterium]
MDTPLPKPMLPSHLATYWRLLRYVRHYWLIFIVSVLGMWLFSAMEVAFVDLLGYLVNVLTVVTGEAAGAGTGLDITTIDTGLTARLAERWVSDSTVLEQGRVVIPLMIIAVAVLRAVGFVVGNYGMSYVSQSIVDNLRNQIFEKYTRMPSAFFDLQMAGHLVAQLTFHVQQVMGATANALKVIIREGSLVIGLLVYMFILNWQLALIFGAVMPLIALIISYVSKRFRLLSKRIQNAMGEVTQVSNEAVSGYREMRLFGGEDFEIHRMHSASRQNRRQSLKLSLTESLSTPIVQILVAAVLALLIWLAMVPDMLGSMSTGGFTKFLLTAGLLAKPLRQLTQINSTIQRGIAAATVLFETLDAEEERDNGRHRAERVSGGFVFEDVAFTYAGASEPAIKGVSFTAEPGQTIALVGSSGSGKSTLVSLIPRFYNHQGGRILLDGVEINDYDLKNLRSHIALVSQQVTLFNDSVYNNIAYGELATRGREAVREAARAAHALDFIEALPEGFDTRIGDDGVMLSGGQRQRIAIARALLKNAPILILDEATSALDTESERHIQAALEVAMQGRTTFVIAHRLSTVENADVILVLEKGRIVEQGDHRGLLARGGRYAQLYQKQFAEV